MLPIRLYLVDDHRVFLDGLTAIINNQPGFEVSQSFSTAHALLESLPFEQPDIIITDINMPGMDGIDLTKEILQKYPQIKIMVLSMHTDGNYVRKAMAAGAKAYVLKDSKSEEVFEAIQTIASGDTYISPRASNAMIQENQQMPELTPREIQVLQSIADGLSTKEIADTLNLSHHTVDTHRKNLMIKSKCNNVGHLVAWGIKNRIIQERPSIFVESNSAKLSHSV